MTLTLDQQKAIALASARKRRADAEGNSVTNGAAQFGSGLNEGIANFAGAPVDILTSALNLGISGVNGATGADIAPITDPVGGSGTFKRALDPFITAGDPQTATQRYLRRGGQEVGFGVPAALTGASMPKYGAAAREALGAYLGTSTAGDVGAAVAGQTSREIAPDSNVADFIASLIGGGLASYGASRFTKPTAAVPTLQEVKKTAADKWAAVKSNGAQLTDNAMAGLEAKLSGALPDSQLAPEAYPNAFKMADTVGTLKNPTVYDVEEARRIIGDAVAGDPKEARVGVQMKRAIEDYLGGIGPNDVTGGSVDSVISDLSAARKATHQAAKADAVINKEMRGETRAATTGTGGNEVNATRQNIRTLYDRERDPTLRGQRQGYTPDEMAAMGRVVEGTPGQNVARLLGRLSPNSGAFPLMASGGGLATAAAGLATGNPAMTLAAAPSMIGMAAKTASENMTKKEIERLLSTILNGGKAPAKSAARSASEAAVIQTLLSRAANGNPQ